MRQIVLDTETTGLEHALGHRIIEIGAVEIVNRRATGRTFHHYIDPERDVDEGAAKIHGIRRAQLIGKPKFAEVAPQLIDFINGAEMVAHNATFDVEFLDMELRRLGETRRIGTMCQVLDTLMLARQMHPGQSNNLDALCKRYKIDNSHRELHGALLDARILADVYLAMTGGQDALALTAAVVPSHAATSAASEAKARPAEPLVVIRATQEELQAHEAMLKVIAKASGGKCLWQTVPAALAS